MNNILLNGSAVRYLRLFSVLPLLLATDVAMAVNCNNPWGPEEVIECYAASLTPAMTGTEFWNNRLFSTKVLDGFCQKPLSDTTPSPNVVENALYTLSCVAETGSYFSYANFLAADQELRNRLGDAYQFMRQGPKELKQQELANLLATVALETSGVGAIGGMTQYQQDGLYFRYEVREPLQVCYSPLPNPNFRNDSQRDVLTAEQCKDKTINEFITKYYPWSTYVVATQGGLVNTAFVSDQDCQYNLTQPAASYKCFNTSLKNNIPTILPGGQLDPPVGYTWEFMNQIIPSAYWIGMGNLQLTKDSMTKFFGWYHQNIASPKVANADMRTFVERYLKEGKLAWEGGLWYWNFRNSNMDIPSMTLHTLLTGAKAACHDIGITTVLINGADQCNEAPQRIQYYDYFKTAVFKLSSTPIQVPGGSTKETSMICSKTLLDYCSKLAIGDTGPAGGVVFYLDASGKNGMEAARGDQASAEWGCKGQSVPGARHWEIGTGKTNTADIVAGCATPGIAAKVASAYSLNGYQDWYLPSFLELDELYNQKAVVGGFNQTSSTGFYWTSTEEDGSVADQLKFRDGVFYSIPKDSKDRVRAIRSFTQP